MEGSVAASASIGDDDARYALDRVTQICTQIGPGVPGSAEERARAAFIKDELESHLGPGTVVIEDFTAALGPFVGSFPISAVLMLIAALANVLAARVAGAWSWVCASVALALSLSAVALVLFEFVLDREVIDRLCRKRRSQNVVGTLRPPGPTDVSRVLIVSGHHDSAPANTWMGLLGYDYLVVSVIAVVGLLAMLAMSVVQLTGIAVDSAAMVRAGTLGWITLACLILPSAVHGLFFTTGKRGGGIVPGAADNLSACGVVMALCRFLVRNPVFVPADTEIRFITFGSEEAGLRGSRHYVERHRDELKRFDTRVLNFEVVAHPEIAILTSDVNGTVKHSLALANSVAAAAARAGVPYRVKPAGFGVGTDAASFSRAGVMATTAMCFDMPRQIVTFYHQKADRPEVLTVEPLSNALKLALEWIRRRGDER